MSAQPSTAAVITDRGQETTDAPVHVVLMSPVQIIAVRTVRTYLQSFLGLFFAANIAAAAGATAVVIGNGLVNAVGIAAVAALAPAIIALVQNTIELLTSLDNSAPAAARLAERGCRPH